MPDLTPTPTHCCNSTVLFEMHVAFRPGRTYRVRYGMLWGNERERQGCTHGWTCDCKAHGICKHIAHAQTTWCGWNESLEAGIEADRAPDGTLRCPKCGGPALQVSVGV